MIGLSSPARIALASALTLSMLTVAGSASAQDPAYGAPTYAPGYPPGPPPPPPPPPPEDEERTAKNAVYFELLGNGGVYSINYERFIDDWGIRAGFSYISIDTNNSDGSNAKASLATFPIVGSYYLGGKNNKIQLGLGATFIIVSASESSIDFAGNASGFVPVGTAIIGYRYMPSHGGFNFGIGFTPLFGPNAFLPWGGMQLGATF